jgi:hypothetical protein
LKTLCFVLFLFYKYNITKYCDRYVLFKKMDINWKLRNKSRLFSTPCTYFFKFFFCQKYCDRCCSNIFETKINFFNVSFKKTTLSQYYLFLFSCFSWTFWINVWGIAFKIDYFLAYLALKCWHVDFKVFLVSNHHIHHI